MSKIKHCWRFLIRYGLYRCPVCWKKLYWRKCNHSGWWVEQKV